MTKKLAGIVILFLLLGTVIFALPKVDVTVTSTNLRVSTKIYTYDMNLKKGLLRKGRLIFKNNQLFWIYGGDGFDLYASDTKLIPTGWSVNGGKKGHFETTSNVRASFFYTYKGEKIKKTITFVNGPDYKIEVSVTGPKNLKMKLNFPTLMSAYNRVNDNGKLFTTYSSGYKNIGIATSNGKFNGNGASSFTTNLKGVVYLGPVKNSEIFAIFSQYESVITRILKEYPGSEPWYGWFLYLFVRILNWIYSWSGNYGWAIIIFAVLVRLSIYPLSHVQMKSMVQMRKIQPKVKEVQKKFKDPKKQQEELMKVYKSEGVNPTSGCLLSLVQLPVLFLLYYVIIYSKEAFAYNGQFLIWSDLSVGGIGPNWILILSIVLLTAWSTLWTSTNAKQAWQSILMFSVMEFFFMGFPVGLFLYYTTFSAMQLVTTYVVAKMYHIRGITIRELFGMNPKRKYSRR